MSLSSFVGATAHIYQYFLMAFLVAMNTYELGLVLVGFWRTRRVIREVQPPDQRRMLRSPLTPPVSVLAPAYNEAANVVENVRSLLALDYRLHEVIVINDGSTDRTLDLLREHFGLEPSGRNFETPAPCRPIRAVYESADFPKLVVVDKENGGKADALNAGLNLSLYPLFCAIDVDSVLEPDALLRLVRPFINAPGVTVAAGGVVRIANGCDVRGGRVRQVRLVRRLLPMLQVVEYLRAFLFGRMAWTSGNGLLIISGAFGLFEKRAVLQAGGYARDTVGEDMELVVRLHRTLREQRRRYHVAFIPDPICWTEVPESIRVLRRQRTRWQRGLIDTLWRHRKMCGRPRYGAAGVVAMPAFALFEAIAPLVGLSGYLLLPALWFLGLTTTPIVLTFLAAAVLYGVGISAVAVLLEDLTFRRYAKIGDLALLLGVAVVENLGYRQLTAWWRARAWWEYLRGDLSWGAMERRGVASA